MKNKLDTIITISFIILGIVIFSYIGYVVYNDFFKKVEENVVIKNLELYGYSLQESDTELYKSEFDNLSNTLNKETIDFEEYAKCISKLYVIDFYTLSNKVSNTDIGGLEFIYPEIKDNFKLKAKDTIYKYIEVNYNGKREQKLPEVSEVNVEEVTESKYKIGEEEFDSYVVKTRWQYVEDLGYQTSAKLTIIKDSSKLYIVESE
jgi:hypothetical protein